MAQPAAPGTALSHPLHPEATAFFTQVVRASMIEALSMEYMRTA